MALRTSLLRLASLQHVNGAVQVRSFTSQSTVLREESGAGGSGSSSSGGGDSNSQASKPPVSSRRSIGGAADFAAALKQVVAGPAGSVVRDPTKRRQQDDTSVYGGPRANLRPGQGIRANQQRSGGGGAGGGYRQQRSGGGGGGQQGGSGGGGGGGNPGGRGGYNGRNRQGPSAGSAQAGFKGNDRFGKRRGAPSVLRQARPPKGASIPRTINPAQKLTGTNWALADARPLHTPFTQIPYKSPPITLENLRLGPPPHSSRPLQKVSRMLRSKLDQSSGLLLPAKRNARFGVSAGALPLTRLPDAGKEKPLAEERQQLRILALQESQGGDYKRLNMQDAYEKGMPPVEKTAVSAMLSAHDFAPSHIDFTVDAVQKIVKRAGGAK